jgi:DinB superfamily
MNAHLQRLRVAIDSATQNMSEADLALRPSEGKWSVAEILEHLSLTYKGTSKNMGKSLAAGKPLGGRPSVKQRLIDVLVLDIGYLPTGRDSPEGAKPKGMPGDEVLSEIRTRLANMDEVIQTCENKFGSRAFVADHPVLGPITMQQWPKFHLVHGMHHVRQILRMRRGG